MITKDNFKEVLKLLGFEYKKAIDILENDARNQLFSCLQQETSTKFLALYTSDFVDGKLYPEYYLINTTDNKALLENNQMLRQKLLLQIPCNNLSSTVYHTHRGQRRHKIS